MVRLILLINLIVITLYGQSFRDTETGLQWYNPTQNETPELTWHEAKVFCEDLVYDSHSDWRLPKIRELYSLVDITKRDPAIKSGLEFTELDYYWSITTSASNSSKKWSVDFENGYIKTFHESNDFYVRCVR